MVALNGVTFEVTQGEVHALVGENGAGKSTLMAVAAGSTAPDSGAVEIGGQLLEQASPAAAQALGLAVVYQHLSILEDLTVSENMVFAMPRHLRPTVARAAAWTRAKVEATGARIDPAARVAELSIADRQLLEIAKALALESKVLVLDEPTESLTPAETVRLFERIRSITERGTAVVYISHRLPEVEQIADRITVLRDGETRGTLAASEYSEAEVLRLIIGRAVDQVFPGQEPGRPRASLCSSPRGSAAAAFATSTSKVGAGEIVGLAGVEGNGQREFLRALAGLLPAQGALKLAGRSLPLGDPAGIQRAGVVHLPGDRHAEGLMLPLSVRENMTLLSLGAVANRGFVQRRDERSTVQEQIQRLSIKTPIRRDTRLVALGWQPAEGSVRPLAACRTHRPARRRADARRRRRRAHGAVPTAAERRRRRQGGRRALVGRGRAPRSVRPGARVLARRDRPLARG